jgi:hypothetical protein
MAELPNADGPTPTQCWSRAVTAFLECQWQFLQAPYQASLKMLETVVRQPDGSLRVAAAAGPTLEEEVRTLERLALEQARKGFAPPRKVYEAPYRDRIDWSAFPDWAQPNDPDLYEGCAHEG